MDKEHLIELYTTKRLSAAQIAALLGCSQNRINYWLTKHKIPKRTISDAIYNLNHPDGNPFTLIPIDTIEKATLYGMGMGLYWGEGTKAAPHSVRLGNSNPNLIKTFMHFLEVIYAVPKYDLKFGLQLFTDCDIEEALKFWMTELEIERSQFYKVHVTISGSIGTYRKKSQYGVVTLYYHNTRLRNILVNHLNNMPR